MLPNTILHNLSLLKEKIEQANTIALFGHQNIDPDSLGAMLGFGIILEKLGKQVSYYTSIQPSSSLAFMHGVEKVTTLFDYNTYDLICFMDFSGYDRIPQITKGYEQYFDTCQKVIIDHHIENKEIKNALIIRDTESSSTCGLCIEIATQLWNTYINTQVATLRYTGLMTDTGNFMRSKDTKRDYTIAIELLNYGADKDSVIKNLYYSAKHNLIPMAEKVLGRSTITGDILYTWYTQEELDENNLFDDDLESIQMVLKSLQNIPVFLRLRKTSTGRSGSLRSGWDKNGKRYNVERIASSFPVGGGHIFAAGFSEDRDESFSLEDDVKHIVKLIQQQIDKQK